MGLGLGRGAFAHWQGPLLSCDSNGSGGGSGHWDREIDVIDIIVRGKGERHRDGLQLLVLVLLLLRHPPQSWWREKSERRREYE